MAVVRVLILLCLLTLGGGCRLNNYTERGAAWGGLSGAGLGAAIGEMAADEPLVGATLGSAVGAMTGASVGSALDEIDSRNQARVSQALYAQQTAGLSREEIVAMANAGLHEEIIVRHIQTHGFHQRLDAADLIDLRQRGVSDRVIGALQEEASRPIRVAPTDVAPPVAPPVVIEEHAHFVPYAYPPPWRYRHFLPRPPGPQFHWGLTFGH